jgi:hypothetical protein
MSGDPDVISHLVGSGGSLLLPVKSSFHEQGIGVVEVVDDVEDVVVL